MKKGPYNHKLETHVGWHNRGCVWDRVATEWAGDEALPLRCGVSHIRAEDKVPRILGSAGKTIHIREDGRQCSHLETVS